MRAAAGRAAVGALRSPFNRKARFASKLSVRVAGGALALTTLTAVGCGGGQEPVDADRAAIAAVLTELRRAQDAGDADTACRDVYAIQEPGWPAAGAEGDPDAEAEAEGEGGDAEAASGAEAPGVEGEGEGGEEGVEECRVAFRAAVARRRREVSDLTTEIGSIEVEDDTATAIVHTELRRQDGSLLRQDVPYDLVRTAEGWRVRISEEG